MDKNLNQKINTLHDILSRMKNVAVAFSGGVDSTLLLRVAHETQAGNVLAVTTVSPSTPSHEKQNASDLAEIIGARHMIIETDETSDPDYIRNDTERCYYCKSILLRDIKAKAESLGFTQLIEGTNIDDLFDHRPGARAVKELNVRSPLQESGFSKLDIRAYARSLGLPNWDKPAMPCLSTRIPYGTAITEEKLGQAGKAEDYISGLGISNFRVRHHGDLARIEAPIGSFEKIIASKTEISGYFRSLGFKYITLDLDGFRSGSLNEGIGKNE